MRTSEIKNIKWDVYGRPRGENLAGFKAEDDVYEFWIEEYIGNCIIMDYQNYNRFELLNLII